MRYLSVCSGIEAATVAWHPLGWEAAAFSEIEAFPRAVLKHHYPDTPLHGDFTTIGAEEYGTIDLLVGGTPCQSFSIAGLRGGLADDRGNLALEFLRLAQRTRAKWLVWENVPGVLSSDGGRDFGAILGGMAELGYGFAYRVLDAQFFGVPQRRRRVFVVGHLGDWRRAAEVLFERESLSGHPAPRREKGQVAPTIPSRSTAGGGLGTDFDCDGGCIAYNKQRLGEYSEEPVASTLSARDYKDATDLVAHTLHGEDIARTLSARHDGSPCDDRGPNIVSIQERAVSENEKAGPDGKGWREDGQAYTLEARSTVQAVAFAHQAGGKQTTLGYSDDGTCQTLGAHQTPAVAFDLAQITSKTNRSKAADGLPCPTLLKDSAMHVATTAVRRLTPRECERLQGFPDDYTQIPYRRKDAENCPDGPRYKALGNSMAVPVMRWIGERIDQVQRREASRKQHKD